MTESYQTHEIKELFAVLAMFLLVGFGIPLSFIFIPQLGGLSGTGDPDFRLQGGFVALYLVFALVGLFTILAIKIREISDYKNKEASKGILSYMPLHDFDQDALIGKIKFLPEWLKNILRSPLKVYIISIIIFSIGGIYQVQTGQFLSQGASIVTQQQLNPLGQAVLGAEPPASAENLFFSAILALIYGLFRWLQYKFRMPNVLFWILAIIFVPIVIGLLWMSYHGLVYGGKEVALFATFFFAYLGSLFTLLFGTIIIWWAWHQMNNLFIGLHQHYSSDAITLVTILILVTIFVLYGLWLYLTRKSKEYIENVAP